LHIGLKHDLATILLVFFGLVLISNPPANYKAFAERPAFSQVRINDPPNDWILKRTGSSVIPLPDGRIIMFAGDAISTKECKIVNFRDISKDEFPAPDISSIGYHSNGKTLNSTVWLTNKIGQSALNNSRVKFLNYSDVFQAIYAVIIEHAENKTLNQVVREHIINGNRTLNNFHFYSNESGIVDDSPYLNSSGEAYRIVFSYSGGKFDVCKNCKVMDTLVVEDGKVYVFSYYSDISKYSKFLPTTRQLINVTRSDIGSQRGETYKTNKSLTLGNASLTDTEKNQIPWIGISTAGITPEIANAIGIERPVGRTVGSVIPRSPAEQAGVRGSDNPSINGRTIVHGIGDLILAADNKVIINDNLSQYVQKEKSIGDSLKLTVLREGQTKQLNLTVAARPKFFSYQNSTYRIKIQYPSNWEENEINSFAKNPFNNNRFNNIVNFFAPTTANASDNLGANMRVIVDNSPIEDGASRKNINLDSYLAKIVHEYKIDIPSTSILYSNTNFSLGDSKAYTLVYTYTSNGTTIKVREIGTIIGDDKVLKIQYFARKTQYETYLPIVQKMIDSFKPNVRTLTHENSYFKIEYPYNWAEMEYFGSPELSVHDDNGSNIIAAVSLVSPVKDIYQYSKLYRMNIDYDSPYDSSGQSYTPYSIVLLTTPKQPKWTKIIREWSLAGPLSRILYNATTPDDFIQESNGFVILNLDLDYLSLPSQFYVAYSAEHRFLKDGKFCYLQDATDFVSSPPPKFAINTLPNSLSNLRPGEERNIQVQIKSFTALPFEVSLSAEASKNLELTFRPNKTSGIPNDLTVSTLHIKVLPNATEQTYTLPIHANILLTPTNNLNNSTSPQITKISNFTITVSPPLGLSEQISTAWSGFGSAINGFVTLLAAIIGIGGIIGGWFLRKFRSKGKKNNFDEEYRKKYNEGW
jgi:hypothetical protein